MSSQDEMRDAELSRLYREVAAGEPPAHLDAAILAAAQREAARAAPRRDRPWWRRWTIPVSVAALVVLSVSLSLLVSREQDRVEIPAPVAAPAVPKSPPAPGTERAPSAAPPREAQKAAVPEPPVARDGKRAPAPVPEQQPESPANVMERKEEARRSDVFVPEPKAAAKAADGGAAPAASLPPAAGEAEAAAGAAADAAKPGAGAEPRTAPQGSGILSAPAGAGSGRSRGAPLGEALRPPSPEAWIEEIRTLRRQGREREAAERLEEFRRAYPGYALPEDLRQPLR